MTRSECKGPGICTRIRCKHHMLWGFIPRLGFSKGMTQDQLIDKWLKGKTDEQIIDLIETLPETCTLDVADRTATLDEIGSFWGLTRERIRQIEITKSEKLGKGGAIKALRISPKPEIGVLREFLRA